MIKSGVVKPGSPSVVSGKPADIVKNGEALCRGEKAPASLKKMASQLPPEKPSNAGT